MSKYEKAFNVLAVAEATNKPISVPLLYEVGFVDALNKADKMQWVPVTWRDATKEELEEYGEDVGYMLTCKMPEHNEEILICTQGGYVEHDRNFEDYGYYLDSGRDWCEDVIAWMPLPEPYRQETIERNKSNE